MNLNDNYEGGDLIFTDQNEEETKRLKLSAGSLVFFPSNFMYPHSIEPITKGKRYSIVAWLQ
jgi:predicted 2-oxoglutarate/Fe(II)-dependent dioxygenase YbiX